MCIFSLIIIILFCFLYINNNTYLNQIENMDLINMISFNVITLSNIERLLNIEEQEKKLNIKINKFNGIKGNQLNQNELVKNKILDINYKFDIFTRSNEIGCYLSHLNLLKSLKSSNYKYHIILEDDFKFVQSNNFIKTINKIISETVIYSFDIIFIGWNNDNELSFEYFSPNLYWFNNKNNFYGTYGYLVNSNSLDKIIDLISYVDMPIDMKYKSLYLDKKLNLYWSTIKLIEHNYNLTSTILSN